jgi:hypothetical protein
VKKNAVLLLLAALLATFTYFYEEKGKVIKANEEQARTQLFDPSTLGELVSFSSETFKLDRVNGHWRASKTNRLGDDRNVDSFMKALEAIRVSKILLPEEINPQNRESFFPKDSPSLSFVFTNGKLNFSLGNKLSFDQSFYIEVETALGKRALIAFDSSAMVAAYEAKDSHRSDHKYRRLRSLFLLPEEYFHDNRLIKREQLAEGEGREVERIKVEGQRNRAYEIILETNSTLPLPPKGIAPDVEGIYRYFSDVMGLEGTSWQAESDDRKLSVMRSELSLYSGERELIRLKLWGKWGKETGDFVTSSQESGVFILTPEAVRETFLAPLQMHWNLSLSNEAPKEIEIHLPERSFTAAYREDKIPPFALAKGAPGQTLKQKACETLWNILSSRADRVEVLARDSASGMALYEISFDERRYKVELIGREMAISSEKDQLRLYYAVPEGMPLRPVDFFL